MRNRLRNLWDWLSEPMEDIEEGAEEIVLTIGAKLLLLAYFAMLVYLVFYA